MSNNELRNKLAFEFQKSLAPMVAENVLSREAAEIMVAGAVGLLDTFQMEVALRLETQYREWETGHGTDDGSLYSLGLRHARDEILGLKWKEDLISDSILTEEKT